MEKSPISKTCNRVNVRHRIGVEVTWGKLFINKVIRWNSEQVIKVAYTSGPIFEKIMKRYPIFSVQIINYQIDQKYK